MATVVLAIGDKQLRLLCREALPQAGHATVVIDRPLELLQLETRFSADVVLVDGSPLGIDALRVARIDFAGRLIGLGVEDRGVAATVALPLSARQVVDAVHRVAVVPSEAPVLTLEAGRRVARANGREVALTRTEVQLLEALLGRRGGVVTLDEAMEALWGAGDWTRNLTLLRAHMRNLRLKLAQVGLANAIRSRRGRGYALAL
jgi:DNA-binding response OmpR family regulator